MKVDLKLLGNTAPETECRVCGYEISEVQAPSRVEAVTKARLYLSSYNCEPL